MKNDGYSRPRTVDLEADFRSMIARSFDDPDTLCREQEFEMRRAFMGGAVCVLAYITEYPLAAIASAEQLEKFVQDVRKGVR